MAGDEASMSECGCPGCQKGALCWEAGKLLKDQYPYQCCSHCNFDCFGQLQGHNVPCSAEMCLEGRRKHGDRGTGGRGS